MKYMGSKNRIAKYILPIMLKERGNRVWVEPFVGGANLIDKVSGDRIGADNNPYLIQALQTIQCCAHELPKNNLEFTEQDYKLLRKDDSYRFKGFAGFAYSYSGKWLGGWCRDGAKQRDYVAEAYRNAVEQSKNLAGINFVLSDYQNLYIPPYSLVYCDPPYANTTKYKSSFDSEKFWNWCRDKVREGHIVFISEYTAPDDFECVWEKKIVSSLTKNTGSKFGTEKLFKYKGS